MSRATLVLLLLAACGRSPASATLRGTTPTTAAPTTAAATVRWIDNGFDVTGLPAVASDGSLILIAEIAEDGGRGNPNLALVTRDRGDREHERLAVLAADDADTLFDASGPLPALRASIAGANERLSDLHQRHDLRPLTALETASEPQATLDHRAQGLGLAVTWNTRQLTIRRGDRVVVDISTPATWLTPDRPMCQDCPETCSNPAFLRAAHGDPDRAVVLLAIGYGGTDMCWEPDSQHHVISW